MFVRAGGTLIIRGAGTMGSGSVDEGEGAGTGGDGTEAGSGIFLQNATVQFDPQAVGDIQIINDVIADDTGNGGNSGAILKTGAGTLVFAGINTYTGTTTVGGGLLQVDGSIAGSATTVNNGGTLGGNGITGAVTVAAGGTLAPGASAGILNTGSIAFAAGAILAIELGGTSPGVGGHDRLDVTGTVDLTGATIAASLIGGFNPALGATFTIIANDGSEAVTGTFAGLANGAPSPARRALTGSAMQAEMATMSCSPR